MAVNSLHMKYSRRKMKTITPCFCSIKLLHNKQYSRVLEEVEEENEPKTQRMQIYSWKRYNMSHSRRHSTYIVLLQLTASCNQTHKSNLMIFKNGLTSFWIGQDVLIEECCLGMRERRTKGRRGLKRRSQEVTLVTPLTRWLPPPSRLCLLYYSSSSQKRLVDATATSQSDRASHPL